MLDFQDRLFEKLGKLKYLYVTRTHEVIQWFRILRDMPASALDLKWRGLGSRYFALTVPPPRVPMNYQRSLMKKLEGKLLLPHKAGKIPAPWITLLDPFLGLYYFMLQDNFIKHQVCFTVWKFFLSIERSYWLPWGRSVPQHSWKCNIPTGVKIHWTKSKIS